MTSETHLNRQALAAHWNTSTRTIDRLRQAGKLPWIDLSGGRGIRPLVRFKIEDVEKFEETMRHFHAEVITP
jgi:hypothetical protein